MNETNPQNPEPTQPNAVPVPERSEVDLGRDRPDREGQGSHVEAAKL